MLKNTFVKPFFNLEKLVGTGARAVAELCSTLWDPMDCSLPSFSVHGIFPARIREWSFPPLGTFLMQGSNPFSCISFAGRFFNAESLGKSHVLEIQIYNKFTNFEDLKSSLALHVELDAPLNLSCIYSIHFSFSGLEIKLVFLRRINHNRGTKTHFQRQKKGSSSGKSSV